MRSRGFSGIEIIGALLAAAALAGAIAGGIHLVTSYIEGERQAGHDAGRKAALLEVEQRDNEKLLEANAEILRLGKLAADLQQQLGKSLASIDATYRKGVHDGNAKADAVIADIHAGRLVLRDPGTGEARSGSPGGGGGAVPAAAGDPAVGDGAQGAPLSARLSDFLVRQFSGADNDLKQLTAAQDGITALTEALAQCTRAAP